MSSMTIEDDGIGIPPELLPRVFDLFVQGARGAYGRPADLASGSRWSGASCNCTAALSMRPRGARGGGACSQSIFSRPSSPRESLARSLTPRADRPAHITSSSPRSRYRGPRKFAPSVLIRVIQRAAFYGGGPDGHAIQRWWSERRCWWASGSVQRDRRPSTTTHNQLTAQEQHDGLEAAVRRAQPRRLARVQASGRRGNVGGRSKPDS